MKDAVEKLGFITFVAQSYNNVIKQSAQIMKSISETFTMNGISNHYNESLNSIDFEIISLKFRFINTMIFDDNLYSKFDIHLNLYLLDHENKQIETSFEPLTFSEAEKNGNQIIPIEQTYLNRSIFEKVIVSFSDYLNNYLTNSKIPLTQPKEVPQINNEFLR